MEPQDNTLQTGPRIVINPEVFNDKRDALCVAMNEAFRILMEMSGFDPVSEPTEEQREFFADTAYAGNEAQLRRTIVARICTFDTSVRNPTDEQLQESVEFLESVMEMGAPQNEWEQRAVQRLHDVLAKAAEASLARSEEQGSPVPEAEVTPVEAPVPNEAEEPEEVHGDVLGGVTKEEENELQRLAKLGKENAKEPDAAAPATKENIEQAEKDMDTANGASAGTGQIDEGSPVTQQAQSQQAQSQQDDQGKQASQWEGPTFGKGTKSGLVIGGRERTAAEAQQLYRKMQSGGSVTEAEREAMGLFVEAQQKAAGIVPQQAQPQQAQAQPQQAQAQPQQAMPKFRQGTKSGLVVDKRQATNEEANWIYRRYKSGASVAQKDKDALRAFGLI